MQGCSNDIANIIPRRYSGSQAQELVSDRPAGAIDSTIKV